MTGDDLLVDDSFFPYLDDDVGDELSGSWHVRVAEVANGFEAFDVDSLIEQPGLARMPYAALVTVYGGQDAERKGANRVLNFADGLRPANGLCTSRKEGSSRVHDRRYRASEFEAGSRESKGFSPESEPTEDNPLATADGVRLGHRLLCSDEHINSTPVHPVVLGCSALSNSKRRRVESPFIFSVDSTEADGL